MIFLSLLESMVSYRKQVYTIVCSDLQQNAAAYCAIINPEFNPGFFTKKAGNHVVLKQFIDSTLRFILPILTWQWLAKSHHHAKGLTVKVSCRNNLIGRFKYYRVVQFMNWLSVFHQLVDILKLSFRSTWTCGTTTQNNTDLHVFLLLFESTHCLPDDLIFLDLLFFLPICCGRIHEPTDPKSFNSTIESFSITTWLQFTSEIADNDLILQNYSSISTLNCVRSAMPIFFGLQLNRFPPIFLVHLFCCSLGTITASLRPKPNKGQMTSAQWSQISWST